MDIDNRTNKILLSFDQFSKEFLLGYGLIDIFPSYFSFHSTNQKSKESIKAYTHKLDNIVLLTLVDPKSVVVVSDASIKNQVATSIAHIHIHNSPLIKTIHHVINISFTEVELFTIRCGINQATYIPNISYIIIITDSIHATKRIFNSFSHSFQIHALLISSKLWDFFAKESNNSIEFWDFLNYCKWSLHNAVDKETKKFEGGVTTTDLLFFNITLIE